jgi:ubiquinone/menaquinone biosynthesis C-methylase UbiE
MREAAERQSPRVVPAPARRATEADGQSPIAEPPRASTLVGRRKTIGGSRRDYVATAVDSSVEKVLDVGCAYGWALDSLRGKANELWGIDADEAVLSHARATYPDVHFVHGSAASLPFRDEEFDVVVLSEVIEHLQEAEKGRALDEVHRVLKTGGLLVFTAPYAGLLAWTDPLDFKRRFPSVYGLYMRLSGYTPTTPPEVGHKHLSQNDISALFRNRFEIEEIRFCGLLTPFVTWLLIVGTRLHVLPRRLEWALGRFRAWESGVPYGSRLSFNVRIRARKRKGT